MKFCYHFLLSASFSLIASFSVNGGVPCGNIFLLGVDAPPVCAPPIAGTNLFEPYTGNAHRAIPDLEVWGSVGEIPLVWMRYGNSRLGRYVYNYGDAHNWNSSFNYNMTDIGLSDQNQPQILVHYPEGGDNIFTRDGAASTIWSPLAGVDKRLFQQGNFFFLQMANGHRLRFEKLADDRGLTYYQLQDIRDSQQNLYVLTYDSNHRLSRITEPAGRYLQITYTTVNNAADPRVVISQVETNDGRMVKYNYDVISDPLNPSGWVSLTSVDYGDGTKATYTYSQSSPGTQPNLEHAIDPRYPGTAVNVRYTYYNEDVWGFVKEEKNGLTGEVLATLIPTMELRTVCYPNGRIQVYLTPDELLGETRTYTNGLGSKIFYTYDREGIDLTQGPGFKYTETDAFGREVVFNKRTSLGNPLEITYPDGTKELYTRDDLDLVLTHTDRLGRLTSFTRDNNHLVTRIDYPDHSFETFTYNQFGQVLDHAKPNGGQEHFVYNSRGLKTQFSDAAGNVTRLTYDPSDKLSSVTDARGYTTAYSYNERGLLTMTTNPDGSTLKYDYDVFGNMIRIINEIGNPWLTSYDEFRRPINRTDPLGRTTRFGYDLPGGICGCTHDRYKPTSITLPDGKLIQLDYDVEWHKVRDKNGAGTQDEAITSYEYDLAGNLQSIIDPKGKQWTYEYDSWDRRRSETDPLGHKTELNYDAAGNVLSITRSDSGVTTFTYDNMNRLTRTVDAQGHITVRNYNAAGNLSEFIDANGNNYQLEYDLLDHRTKILYSNGTSENFTYDLVGNLSTYGNRSGDLRTYTYDNRNREILSTWSNNDPAVNRSYDPAGRIMAMSSSVSSLTFSYNNANELISETQDIAGGPGPKTVNYTYNTDAFRNTITYPGGTVVSYGYTGRNQVSSISADGLPLVTYRYDGNGNRVNKTLTNGTSSEYAFDEANRMLSINDEKSGVSFARFDYGYDGVGRRTFIKRDGGQGDVFSYDGIDQVTEVKYNVTDPGTNPINPERTVIYLWDAAGNRLSVTDNGSHSDYATNNLNQYTQIAGSPLTYNNNGDLETFDGWTYTYDAQNRLKEAKKDTIDVQFLYDARNRCVRRTANAQSVFLYYDEWKLIEEIAPSGLQLSHYVYGAMPGEILSNTSSVGTVYYHHDALGSVTHLTNNAGNIVEKYSYDIFGTPQVRDANGNIIQASAFNNRFMFTGRDYITGTGLYDFQNRVYASVAGRFLQPNPSGFSEGDHNLFRYVGNNPVNRAEPWKLPDGYNSAFSTFPQVPPLRRINLPTSEVDLLAGKSSDKDYRLRRTSVSDYDAKWEPVCNQQQGDVDSAGSEDDEHGAGARKQEPPQSAEVKVHDELLR